MILVPKRKYDSKSDSGTVSQYVTNNNTELSGVNLKVTKLWVTSRMQIPVGTDKFG